MAENKKDMREVPRKPFQTKIMFYLDPEIIMADSVDISDKGIRLETDEPIDIRIQIEEGDALREYDAKLVWAQQKYDGGSCYGLEYETSRLKKEK